MAVLHSIKAQLYDNVLTENPNDFIARVASEKSLNIKDICLAAATRGGSDITQFSGGGTMLKEPRNAALEKVLSVA